MSRTSHVSWSTVSIGSDAPHICLILLASIPELEASRHRDVAHVGRHPWCVPLLCLTYPRPDDCGEPSVEFYACTASAHRTPTPTPTPTFDPQWKPFPFVGRPTIMVPEQSRRNLEAAKDALRAEYSLQEEVERAVSGSFSVSPMIRRRTICAPKWQGRTSTRDLR
jgi:hypothetical protein